MVKCRLVGALGLPMKGCGAGWPVFSHDFLACLEVVGWWRLESGNVCPFGAGGTLRFQCYWQP